MIEIKFIVICLFKYFYITSFILAIILFTIFILVFQNYTYIYGVL